MSELEELEESSERERERQQLLQLPDDEHSSGGEAMGGNLELSERVMRKPQLGHRQHRLQFDNLILDDVEEDEISVNFASQSGPQDARDGTMTPLFKDADDAARTTAPIGATSSAAAAMSGVRLLDEELLAFVGVYFRDEFMSLDAYHIQHSTNPEVNRHGSRILWVENTQTGQMIAVARRADTGGGADRAEAADGEGAGETTLDDAAAAGQADLEAAVHSADDGAAGTSGMASLIPPPPPPWDDPLLAGIAAGEGATSATAGAGGSAGLTGSDVGGNCAKSTKAELEADILLPIVSYHNLAMVQRAIFLLAQGLLAGFSFTTIFGEQAAGDSDSQYLVYYQPNAYEYRRFFYILTTVSLIGSLDLCFTIISSRRERSGQTAGSGVLGGSGAGYSGSASYQRAFFALNLNYGTASLLFAVAIALFYSVAFLCSLLMAPTDTRIFVRNGFSVDDDTEDWAKKALEDSSFSSALDQWRSLDIVRLIASLAGWLGSCVFVWKDLTQLNYRTADLYRLRESALAWSSRVKEMEGGEGLEKLKPAALRRLIAVLRVGLDRAKNALSFYQQQKPAQE